ncbi:LysM peptidoglycan-binding domain-containing protein [Ancylomarina euxinus]|uniref:LysM peptidoglycan-binding domain-containing protein n=2 Tax=Ancylomarina euxinus TaxID=2283627 RepID=A0A425Y3H7_9BACT|nr:transglycosylase SLT domain-containing protein [Ancylomarina euxinus]RRG22665.1 LysM peptidoglycan-binding domain-containing protein [Ancylomarina euxinus]
MTPAVEKDSLAFLKINPVDVRWDLNDSIQPEFKSNLDKLVNAWYAENAIKTEAYEGPETKYIKEQLADSVYIKRLQSIPSMFDLSYNKIVRNYIELYTQRRRKQVELMMGMSEYYFPIFEEILDKEGLPQELKYLPIIESALNPQALSRAGASGLWQFMYSTGRMYKLEVNSFVDERRDPIKASYAAAKFLKDLYKMYGNWPLVIAAYNCGPGNVNKAIRRSGGKKNYWDIYYRLPKETRGYVPAFIAALYSFNFHEEHGLYPRPNQFPEVCDTLMIKEQLHFDQIAQFTPVSKQKLRELNPQYRADIIPAFNKPYSLKVPFESAMAFIDNQDSITSYKKEYYFNLKDKLVNPRDRYQKFAHVAPNGKAKVYYKVKSGDAVGLIASWFHVRPSDLRYWNNIHKNMIRVGQNLAVYVPKSKVSFYKSFNSMSRTQKQATLGKNYVASVEKPSTVETSRSEDGGDYVYYTVRRHDNFWTIAKKFPGISNFDIMKMNNISDAGSLKVGQKLKIRQKS